MKFMYIVLIVQTSAAPWIYKGRFCVAHFSIARALSQGLFPIGEQ